ncbi:hypothetical protein [Cytobacillus pseudoceanisediminis]|uniref:hypothetical protein n=1 Tax=Cytobacillus pseudoceanisediminis TaxID=3051614 RepID=UPI003C2C9AD1
MDGLLLPISKPILIGYGHHTFPLSIISQNEDYLDWVYSNYIQLYGDPVSEKIDFFTDFLIQDNLAFTSFPWLWINKVSRADLKGQKEDLVLFLKKSLRQQNYLYLYVDEFYLGLNRQHLLKDILIFGFDDQKKMFIILEFENLQLNVSHVSYQDLKKAYVGFEKSYIVRNEKDQRRKSIYLIKNTSYKRYEFNLDLVKEFLMDYLNSNNSLKNFQYFSDFKGKEGFVFGIKVYEQLIQYLTELQTSPHAINVNLFQTLFEHKKIFLLRMEFMVNKGYLPNSIHIERFREIEKGALQIKNKILRYQITLRGNLLEESVELLKQMYRDERKILKEVLTNINK